MPILRETPYPQFNFLVDLGDGDTQSARAGFAEVTGLGTEISVIEYRAGNSRDNSPMKIPGLSRAGDVTLKRGISGSTDLYAWLDQARNGASGNRRTVTISLLNEDRSQTVQTWKLLRAFPIKHVSGPLDASGKDVAIEELVLCCERIELE